LYYHTCHQGTHQMQHTLKESQWSTLLQKLTLPRHIPHTNAFLVTSSFCMSNVVINCNENSQQE
jgi:hypothetical protein